MEDEGGEVEGKMALDQRESAQVNDDCVRDTSVKSSY